MKLKLILILACTLLFACNGKREYLYSEYKEHTKTHEVELKESVFEAENDSVAYFKACNDFYTSMFASLGAHEIVLKRMIEKRGSYSDNGHMLPKRFNLFDKKTARQIHSSQFKNGAMIEIDILENMQKSIGEIVETHKSL